VAVDGVDVSQMHLQISSWHPATIVIPAGTVFASKNGGTQNMIAAKTVTVVFPGPANQQFSVQQVQTLDLEVYCINRLLEAPTVDSSYIVVSGGGELDPVRRLSDCLQNQDADHYSRQLAIWMTSDHFIDMTEDEVREQ